MDASTPDAPSYLDLIPPPEAEDHPPTLANFVNVSGDGDVLALDFFYMHPSKVSRIFEGGTAGPDGVRVGDTVVHKTPPIARLAIPLTTATELVAELVERIGGGVPHLRGVLEEFGQRLHEMSHMTNGTDPEHGDHDHGEEEEEDSRR